MKRHLWVTSVLCLLAAGGCGESAPSEPQPAPIDSAVQGTVLLGPTCPVETADNPCPPQPAAGVPVTVSEQRPGEAYGAGDPVASGTTDDSGAFRIEVPPGAYVVTATAGMSCEFMDVTVLAGDTTTMDVPCDTGIR